MDIGFIGTPNYEMIVPLAYPHKLMTAMLVRSIILLTLPQLLR